MTAPTASAPISAVVPISALVASSDNVRTKLGDVAELAASIRSIGVLEPLIVVANNGNAAGSYTVLAGHRRLAAAAAAGLADVPVIIREASPAERAEIMLVENLQREDLTPLDEARAFRRLLDDHGYDQKRVAERVGRSQAHVSKRLALLALPAPVQKALDAGGMTVADGLALAQIADRPDDVARIVKEHADRPAHDEAGYGIADDVADVLLEVERERATAAAIEAAKSGPIPYVEAAPPASSWSEPRPPKGALVLGKAYGELQITDAKHKGQECDAVTVLAPRYGAEPRTVRICTTPANHPDALKASDLGGNRGGLTDDEKAKRRKHREHKAAIAMATEFRRTFLRDQVLPKLDADAAIADLLAVSLDAAGEYWPNPRASIALELLGLSVGTSKAFRPEDAALKAHAAKSKANAARVASALAFSVYERRLVEYGWTGAVPKAYFQRLTAAGYVLDDAEKRELAGRAPR